MVKHSWNDKETKLAYNMACLIVLYVILLVLQYIPLHPGLHEKHDPLCMWHVLYLQLMGQGESHLLP